MDKYYGNVCELDIIFNFQKAYFILDELLLAGEMQESSKKNVLRCISQQDSLEDMEVSRIQFPLSLRDTQVSFHCGCTLLYTVAFLPLPIPPSQVRANALPGRGRCGHQDHVTMERLICSFYWRSVLFILY